jgi:hypothetical protein
VDALAVPHVAGLAGKVQIGRMVGQSQRDRLGEPARRVHPADEHIGDRATAGLAEQPTLDQRRHRRVP